MDAKARLHEYLQHGRDAMLWKLDGLSDYDLRRPLTPTGTNLLGLVKHLANVEAGYFGDVFGRPPEFSRPWLADDADPNADMWATADESREDIIGLYHYAWRHADATIEALELDAAGQVPWWHAGKRDVTLHQILVHVLAETQRHVGHADILRERIDGAVGLRPDNTNLPSDDQAYWANHHAMLERLAEQVGQR